MNAGSAVSNNTRVLLRYLRKRSATPKSNLLWSVPIFVFYVFVIIFGCPMLAETLGLAAAVGVLELTNLFPPLTSYRAGLGLLVLCPVWRIIDVEGYLGHKAPFYSLVVKMHMSSANETAIASADEAFAFLVVGTSLAVARLASPDK